jgi:hypothetical protein
MRGIKPCPIALEAVQRLYALFDIERAINGKSPAEQGVTSKAHTPRPDAARCAKYSIRKIGWGTINYLYSIKSDLRPRSFAEQHCRTPEISANLPTRTNPA